MENEKAMFSGLRFDREKLLSYGFVCEGKGYRFSVSLKEGLLFEAKIDESGAFSFSMLDQALGEEVLNFKILPYFKKLWEPIVEDIKKNCCHFDVYDCPLACEVDSFILKRFGVSAEFLFSDLPETGVYREKKKGKWFALIMKIKSSSLHQEGDDPFWILNLKAKDASSLLGKPGFFPAYHMNKRHWITIALNGEVPAEMIFPLIEESFALVS